MGSQTLSVSQANLLTEVSPTGSHSLQEIAELFWPQADGSTDRAQGATIKRPVVRHHDLSKRVIAPQDNVTAHLSNEAESHPLLADS